jgi:hypothetical protein
MAYFKYDTENSDLYNASFMYNCHMKKNKECGDKVFDTGYNNYALDDAYSHLRCFIDPVMEQKLRTDVYSLKYRCLDNEQRRNPSSKTYSTCLGYDCKRESNEFMYELDEFNTYHNYPVCKFRGKATKSTCCPENTQIFNNLTRRSMSFPQKPKPPQELLMEDAKIPSLTYHECRL